MNKTRPSSVEATFVLRPPVWCAVSLISARHMFLGARSPLWRLWSFEYFGLSNYDNQSWILDETGFSLCAVISHIHLHCLNGQDQMSSIISYLEKPQVGNGKNIGTLHWSKVKHFLGGIFLRITYFPTKHQKRWLCRILNFRELLLVLQLRLCDFPGISLWPGAVQWRKRDPNGSKLGKFFGATWS